MSQFDTIVLGIGGMGSAALWHIARRGYKVLGIEQFDVAHNRGSSHGGSRLIRRAYFEHPDYVPLVSRAYDLWRELEESSGTKLFHRTGLYLAGPRTGMLMDGVLRASQAHNLGIESLACNEAVRRFPCLRSGPDMSVLYEVDAGFLEVEKCVRTHCDNAVADGARLHTSEKVMRWNASHDGVSVETDRGSYRSKYLVICGGAWSGQVLANLGVPLTIRRKVVVWYATQAPGYKVGGPHPVFCFDTPYGFFYGFPTFDGRTIKVGEHSGGLPVSSPEKLDRNLHDSDLIPLARFLVDHLPLAGPEVVDSSVCMYTMTPDEHFIIDRHPKHDNVFIACGFSGHGFKFASVIGFILADLVTQGVTGEPIEFLSLNRFLGRKL